MNLIFVSFVLGVITFGLAFVRTRVIAYRLSCLCWDDLLSELETLPIEEIAVIALDYLNPGKGQCEIDATALWGMIGEVEGLRRMNSNAKVLLALAGYAGRWDRKASLIVTAQMRQDVVTLRRAALRLSLGVLFGYNRVQGPFSVQEIASAYYLMRGRVLALYETSHVARVPRLASLL